MLKIMLKNRTKTICSICSIILLFLFFALSVSCGGGGGGVSAARGGNNAGKSGFGGGGSSGSTTANGETPNLVINPSQSETLNSLNWQTIQFKIKIGNRTPIIKELQAGEDIKLQLTEEDGLVVGETIDVEAKITNDAGEFEAFSGVQTIVSGKNKITMTVGRKVPIEVPESVTVAGGAEYIVVTKKGAKLPKATTTEKKLFRCWEKSDGTRIFDYQLSASDFATLEGLTPIFQTPVGNDILCTDKTIAANASELGGRKPFGVITKVRVGEGYVEIMSLSETNAVLNNGSVNGGYFPYDASNFDYAQTRLDDSLQFKQNMLIDFPNSANCSAFQYLKTLPNMPDGTPVEWYIPAAFAAYNCLTSSHSDTLRAIGATPLDPNAEYMTATLDKGSSDWDYALYAKVDQSLDEIANNKYAYPSKTKRLRAFGRVSLP